MDRNQRWTQGRDSYRPAEPIRTADYEVRPIPGDTEAKRFVLEHHYSGTFPSARFRFGLYHRGALEGVAVFSHPCNDKVLTGTFPGLARATDAVELGRFVLLDEVPGNGETWFLGRCFAGLRQAGIRAVVSFSDPEPRTDAGGRVIFPGHIGTIYKAHNATYVGRGASGTAYLLPDGRTLHRRSLQKIHTAAQAWLVAVRVLEGFGADTLDRDAGEAERRAWVAKWRGAICRPFEHPGNHKYTWALDRRVQLPTRQPYPTRAAA